MCIHYLLAGVSVTDDQIKNNEAPSNDAPSTSEGDEIHQGNGTDSEEKPEDEKDKKKQATLKGRVMIIFFSLIKCENFLRFPRIYAWVLFAFEKKLFAEADSIDQF